MELIISLYQQQLLYKCQIRGLSILLLLQYICAVPLERMSLMTKSCDTLQRVQEFQEANLVEESKQENPPSSKTTIIPKIIYIPQIDETDQMFFSDARICYRCRKVGHIASKCRSKQELKCMYCLGSHISQKCNDVLCQWCKQVGHTSKCCLTRWVKCFRCGKNGHVNKNCGKIIRQNKQKVNSFFYYQKEDLRKLKCIKCQNQNQEIGIGHHNCHQYPKTIPQIYIDQKQPQNQQQKI